MKTISEPSIISPTILVLTLLAAAVAWIAIKGEQMPVLSNLKVNVVLLIVLGMAICSQGDREVGFITVKELPELQTN